MYIFKNAARSIFRSKGRNVLMGIIVLVIAISTCVALSIKEASKEARESLLDSLNITAQISVDRKSMLENTASEDGGGDKDAMNDIFSSAENLTLDEMLTYAGAESVEDFYYTLSTSLDGSDNIEAIDSTSDDTSDSDSSSTVQSGQNPFGEQGDSGETSPGAGRMGTQGDFTLVGYSSDNAMSDFISGICKITEGTMFEEGTSENACIISDELALYNSLSVGDTLTLTNPNNEEETIELTIVGIYNNSESTTTSENVIGGFSASSDAANQIYMSYNALAAITSNSETNAEVETDDEGNTTQSTALRSQVSGTYVFANVENYEKFESEARALGLSDSYSVSSSDLTEYENSLTPLENLSNFATYFLAIVLIIGGIILVVLNVFNIRERKYEIGVLTAIGMKKSKVALQFISELFLVTFAFIIIGTAAGAAISLPVTNSLLESQITAQQEESASQQGNFGRESGAAPSSVQGGSMPESGGFAQNTTNYISEVSTATNFTVVLQLMGLGILLTLISSLVGVVFILRYEPLKILASRD